MKISFAGGDLSSDAGLLLIKEFTCELGFVKLLKSLFKTNDTALLRFHKDDENLWQVICQILGSYFEDNCADELIHDNSINSGQSRIVTVFYLNIAFHPISE